MEDIPHIRREETESSMAFVGATFLMLALGFFVVLTADARAPLVAKQFQFAAAGISFDCDKKNTVPDKPSGINLKANCDQSTLITFTDEFGRDITFNGSGLGALYASCAGERSCIVAHVAADSGLYGEEAQNFANQFVDSLEEDRNNDLFKEVLPSLAPLSNVTGILKAVFGSPEQAKEYPPEVIEGLLKGVSPEDLQKIVENEEAAKMFFGDEEQAAQLKQLAGSYLREDLKEKATRLKPPDGNIGGEEGPPTKLPSRPGPDTFNDKGVSKDAQDEAKRLQERVGSAGARLAKAIDNFRDAEENHCTFFFTYFCSQEYFDARDEEKSAREAYQKAQGEANDFLEKATITNEDFLKNKQVGYEVAQQTYEVAKRDYIGCKWWQFECKEFASPVATALEDLRDAQKELQEAERVAGVAEHTPTHPTIAALDDEEPDGIGFTGQINQKPDSAKTDTSGSALLGGPDEQASITKELSLTERYKLLKSERDDARTKLQAVDGEISTIGNTIYAKREERKAFAAKSDDALKVLAQIQGLEEQLGVLETQRSSLRDSLSGLNGLDNRVETLRVLSQFEGQDLTLDDPSNTDSLYSDLEFYVEPDTQPNKESSFEVQELAEREAEGAVFGDYLEGAFARENALKARLSDTSIPEGERVRLQTELGNLEKNLDDLLTYHPRPAALDKPFRSEFDQSVIREYEQRIAAQNRILEAIEERASVDLGKRTWLGSLNADFEGVSAFFSGEEKAYGEFERSVRMTAAGDVLSDPIDNARRETAFRRYVPGGETVRGAAEALNTAANATADIVVSAYEDVADAINEAGESVYDTVQKVANNLTEKTNSPDATDATVQTVSAVGTEKKGNGVQPVDAIAAGALPSGAPVTTAEARANLDEALRVESWWRRNIVNPVVGLFGGDPTSQKIKEAERAAIIAAQDKAEREGGELKVEEAARVISRDPRAQIGPFKTTLTRSDGTTEKSIGLTPKFTPTGDESKRAEYWMRIIAEAKAVAAETRAAEAGAKADTEVSITPSAGAGEGKPSAPAGAAAGADASDGTKKESGEGRVAVKIDTPDTAEKKPPAAAPGTTDIPDTPDTPDTTESDQSLAGAFGKFDFGKILGFLSSLFGGGGGSGAGAPTGSPSSAPSGRPQTAAQTPQPQIAPAAMPAGADGQASIVAIPTLQVSADQSSVQKGKPAIITWRSSGMKGCSVRAEGSSADAASFNDTYRTATQMNGAAVTPPLSQSLSVTVTCLTQAGAVEKKTVRVAVE